MRGKPGGVKEGWKKGVFLHGVGDVLRDQVEWGMKSVNCIEPGDN